LFEITEEMEFIITYLTYLTLHLCNNLYGLFYNCVGVCPKSIAHPPTHTSDICPCHGAH